MCLDHHHGECLSMAELSSPTPPVTWCRGWTPHTGQEAFVAMNRMTKGKQSKTTLPARKQGNRAVTAATRYSEGGTSTQECELDQSTKKTTRGAGEEEKQRQEAQQGRAGNTGNTEAHTSTARSTKQQRQRARGAKEITKTQAPPGNTSKQPQARQGERKQHRHSRREAHCAGPE